MTLTISTVKAGLELMARHLKNAPPIDGERVADWVMIFEREMPDEVFGATASRATATLTFFPTPGEFSKVIEQGLEERAEIAWQYAKAAIRKSSGGSILLEDVGGDPATLWAMAAVGRDALNCLFHIVKPENHDVFMRADFIRNYKVAFRFGLGMESWDRGRPVLPASSPALPFIREAALEARYDVERDDDDVEIGLDG